MPLEKSMTDKITVQSLRKSALFGFRDYLLIILMCGISAYGFVMWSEIGFFALLGPLFLVSAGLFLAITVSTIGYLVIDKQMYPGQPSGGPPYPIARSGAARLIIREII